MTDKIDISTELLGRVRRASLNELRDEMVVVIEKLLEHHQRLNADMQSIIASTKLTEALLLGRRRKDPIPQDVTITAGTLPSFAFGFHAADTKASGGAQCWTGPDIHSYIPLLVDRTTEKVLQLFLVNNARAETLQGVRADGQPLKEISRKAKGNTLKVTYRLPPRKAAVFSVIVIEGTDVFCPKDIKPTSHDDRNLGMLFLSLKVTGVATDKETADETAQAPATEA